MNTLIQTDVYGRFLHSKSHRPRETGVSAFFKFDDGGKILTVRGRHVGDIRRLSNLSYQETSDTFQESEQHIHYENLRLILGAASKRLNIKLETYLKYTGMSKQFPLDLLARAGKYPPDPWFRERENQLL